jgi:hypothetical protein
MPLCDATVWDIFSKALAVGLGVGVAFAPWWIIMLWRDQHREARWRQQAEADWQRWEMSRESWR